MNVFCKDTFKEILGDTMGFSDRAENLKLSVASAALMRMIFREFCRLEKDLILESNFRQEELEQLHQIAREYGYDVLSVALRGDLEVLHRRFLNRLYNENRHAVHACGGFEDYEAFREYVLGQRRLTVPGTYFELNANDFSYQQDEVLLHRLDTFFSL